jgi:transcriptional/translational regulatory protein YebC/TACO1
MFSRAGGNLGESGSVAWLFEPSGIITVKTDGLDAEDLALQAIDAGAEDVKVEKGYVEIYTKPDKLEAVRKALEQKKIPIESSQLSMLSKTMITLDGKASLQTLKLLDKLEELDEVQHVTTNADFPEDIVEKYQAGVLV